MEPLPTGLVAIGGINTSLPSVSRPGISADTMGKLLKNMPGLAVDLAPTTGRAGPVDESVALGAVGTSSVAIKVGLITPLPQGPALPPEGTIIPGVKELCARFRIDDTVMPLLDAQLRRRPCTFANDVEAIGDVMSTARSPGATLLLKIKELQTGTYVGPPPCFKAVKMLTDKFNLDLESRQKLQEAMMKLNPEKAKSVIEQLDEHLERSNKPSALVMMNLAKLKKGEDLGEVTRKPTPGSYLYEQQQEKEKEHQQELHARDQSVDPRRSRRDGRGRRGGAILRSNSRNDRHCSPSLNDTRRLDDHRSSRRCNRSRDRGRRSRSWRRR